MRSKGILLALFGGLLASQTTVIFSHIKSAPASSQTTVFFSDNKSAPATGYSEPNKTIWICCQNLSGRFWGSWQVGGRACS